MGKKKSREMLFWTKDEYLKFIDAMMDKPLSFYAFEMLYWCGIREGELLALTPADFDFQKRTVTISKSYQRINGRDVITTPKTEKSNRTITMPRFLVEEIQEYLAMQIGMKQAGFSLIMSGERELKYNTLLQIANALQMSVIDVITFPDKYVMAKGNGTSTEAVLQIKLDSDKKDQILNIVFGEQIAELLKSK